MLKENRNIDHSYTDRVVRQLVDETEIDFKSGRVRLPIAAYSWPFNNFGPGGLENALRMTPSNSFGHHIIDNYGLDGEEFEEVLTKYIEVIAEKINKYLAPIFNLQEQIGYDDDAPNEVERQAQYATQVLESMVKETKIDDSHEDPSQWNIYAPHMGRWISPMGFISPNNRHWTAFEDHVMDIYGLDWELVGTVWNNYLKEITSNFRHLANKTSPEWGAGGYDYLAESTEDKFFSTIVNQLVDETEIEYEYGIPHISAFPDPMFTPDTHFDMSKSLSLNLFGELFQSFWHHCRDVYGLTDPEIQKVWWPYKEEVLQKINFTTLNESLSSRVKKEVNDLFDKDKKLKGEDKIKKYFEDKGLDKWEADQAMVQYLSKQQSLNESVDLSYSDDKDFPFLNQLANHTMSITEISRNAVLFPFIDGYISDGNFYKYFHGTPYDQLPFEATLKLDEYLRDFGLTENEKEIWWDIYVIKVIDAINERDLKIIDNYGELNESTEDMYKKIANSVANESDILEKDGKLYLRSPAFEGGVNVEVVLDIMSGRTKRAIPNSFTKHMKEIYDIEEKGYNTVLETVWGLYRDKMIERIKIKQAQLRQISPKQRKFFDHILKTLVDGTEIQTNTLSYIWDDEEYGYGADIIPPFLNHGETDARFHEAAIEWKEFSFFGSGYSRYMKDIYGLTDKEIKQLWAPYYKGVQKKLEELIERDRIIYGDD